MNWLRRLFACRHRSGAHLGPHPNGAGWGWTVWYCNRCHESLGVGPRLSCAHEPA